MTIKELFDMIDKHNQLAELFPRTYPKPIEIYVVAYGCDCNYFKTFDQFRDHVLDEFIEPCAKSLLNAEIKLGMNCPLGTDENGEIIMVLSLHEE